MTVKIEHVQFADEPDYSWIPDPTRDPTVVNPSSLDVLAMVRHILRDHPDCDRIPLVLGASQTSTVNEWGHNVFVHVRYNRRWQATYAGLLTGDGLANVQCYMD